MMLVFLLCCQTLPVDKPLESIFECGDPLTLEGRRFGLDPERSGELIS